MWPTRRGFSTILIALFVLGGITSCSQFQFDPPKPLPNAGVATNRGATSLGVLAPRDERPRMGSNAVPVGLFFPVPYVSVTIERPERFIGMANNEYWGTQETLRMQIQRNTVSVLADSGIFQRVVAIPPTGDFRGAHCDRYLQLELHSTRAKGAIPTYFVTYIGASPLYLVGFPYWIGHQDLFMDAALLDGGSLKPLWKKSYRRTSHRSYRGLVYGEDPKRAANRLLREILGEMEKDLATVEGASRK
jgi:hypothetical protein